MLIAAGSDGNSLKNKMAKRFGHAGYYIIYDTESQKFEAIKNSIDDHTHSILYELLEKGVNVFIVGNIGPHAFEILNDNKAGIYLARKMTVQEAIQKLSDEKLERLKHPTVKRSINGGHQY